MSKRDGLSAVGACALLSSTVFALWQVPMKTYITTPIYYVNGAPHIGHAHTSVMADILKRNRVAIGYEGKLTTGCDEHGQKNQEAAAESGLSVEEYLDGRSAEFRNVFDRLSVEYDYFVRTSRPEHKQRVAEIEQRMYGADLIVKKEYSGTYCTGCEQFKKPSDLNDDGRCPDHPTLVPEEITEENYSRRPILSSPSIFTVVQINLPNTICSESKKSLFPIKIWICVKINNRRPQTSLSKICRRQ